MSFPRYVGLRLSTTAGAVPTVADMAEGELAINVVDGRVYTLTGSTVIDLTDRYTVSEIDALLGGKAAASHTHPWNEVTSKPSTATRWPTFAEVTDKPPAYPPSAHSHTLAGISDAGTAAAEDAAAFATAAQGGRADSAVQPGDLADVATSGAYADLSGTPVNATTSLAGLMAAADKAKLDDIEAGAEVNPQVIDALTSTAVSLPLSANQGRVLKGLIDSINALLQSDDATLDELQEIVDFVKLNRSELDNLSIASIAGLQSALDARQPLDPVLTATTASFTAALANKLSGIESGAAADQTGAEIKSLYEAEPNTNAFTDSEKSKISAVGTLANRDVYISDQPPDNQVGQDGDIWLQHWS